MKKLSVIIVAALMCIVWTSCSDADARYVNLQTGEKVKLEKDPVSGLMVDANTKKTVHIYVDTKTHDTIFGSTGKVINGNIWKNKEGEFSYSGEGYINIPEDAKVKIEKDGDIKIKTDDKKIKIDGKTGERKEKKD